jgi:cell division protein FtsW (lipid II flippase)
MWDTKRQIIWAAAGFIVGSLVLYRDAFDDSGRFSLSFFLFLELLLLLIMAAMFYFYTRRN